jgi:hypothetical protein
MKKILILIIVFCFCVAGCKKEIQHSDEQDMTIATTAASKGGKPSSGSGLVVQWQKCIGYSTNDYGFSVAKAIDGSGYFVAGTTENKISGRDVLVSKIDLSGNVLWQYTFGGSGADEGTSLVATSEGGCLIAGKTTSNNGDVHSAKGNYDIWLLKLSASGFIDASQTKTLGGSGFDITGQIINTSDGGYAIVGETTSNDGDLAGSGTTKGRAWVIKLDASTNITWQKTLDVSASKDDIGYGITETSADRFALTGRTLDFDNNANIWAASFDRDNVYWTRSFGNPGGDVAFGIVTGKDINGLLDGIVLTGYLGAEAVATKLNLEDGNTAWQKTFKPGSSLARGRSIVATADGYVVAGDNTGDLLIWKLAKDGTFINGTTIGGGKDDNGYDVIATDDGKFLSAGSTSSSNGIVSGNNGLSDMWVVKFGF